MSDIKRREFLKRTAATMGGAAVGVGLPASVITPTAANLARLCPVNTYLRGAPPAAALQLPWSAAAEERVARVPAGFMREVARAQSAKLAYERGAAEVDLATVNDAIARVTAWMNRNAGSA
jgi:hypothetical protein